MSPRRAVIALGSNLGDRAHTILAASRAIADLDDVELVAASGLHETVALTPHGTDPDAPPYVNAVVIVSTSREPADLLSALHGIEHDHGRVRVERWGDRTLDLDLIDVEGVVSSTDALTLPHPRAHERAFVLAPWLEADPGAVLTGRGRVADLLAALPAADGTAPDGTAPEGGSR